MGGGAYLHNVGKRRNSTAPEMTFRHTLQVISTWRRVADVAQRNHFRLAGPEILANPWTPVSIPLRCEKARILGVICESSIRSSLGVVSSDRIIGKAGGT